MLRVVTWHRLGAAGRIFEDGLSHCNGFLARSFTAVANGCHRQPLEGPIGSMDTIRPRPRSLETDHHARQVFSSSTSAAHTARKIPTYIHAQRRVVLKEVLGLVDVDSGKRCVFARVAMSARLRCAMADEIGQLRLPGARRLRAALGFAEVPLEAQGLAQVVLGIELQLVIANGHRQRACGVEVALGMPKVRPVKRTSPAANVALAIVGYRPSWRTSAFGRGSIPSIRPLAEGASTNPWSARTLGMIRFSAGSWRRRVAFVGLVLVDAGDRCGGLDQALVVAGGFKRGFAESLLFGPFQLATRGLRAGQRNPQHGFRSAVWRPIMASWIARTASSMRPFDVNASAFRSRASARAEMPPARSAAPPAWPH